MKTEAAENTTTKSLTMTTTVQPASYELNIPENPVITYGETMSYIGNVTVTGGTNFAVGKNVEVTVTHTGEFAADNVSTTIPFEVLASRYASADKDPNANGVITIANGKCLTFYGKSDTTLKEKATAEFDDENSGIVGNTVTKSVESLCIRIAEDAWGKALAGDYTATITFTTEVVAG